MPPDIVKGGIIEPRTFRAAHRNHADVRCTPAIGQAPHVVQDAEVPFHLQSRPFKVPPLRCARRRCRELVIIPSAAHPAAIMRS